jgi:hypothetical protein
VEDGATDAASGTAGERGLGGGGFGRRRIADETDAAEGMIFGIAEDAIEIGEADGCEGLEGVRQEPLAAGFIDGRLHGIDDFDVKTLTGGGDS